MRIAVYSGQVPGTTFIERLVAGLSHRDNTVLLFGNKAGHVTYTPGIQVYLTPEGRLNMLLYVVVNFLRLAVKYPADINKVTALVKNHHGSDKFRYLVKILPVVLHRPDIFHIQWAKSVKDWIWVKDFGIKLVVSLRGSHINYSPVASLKLAEEYRQLFPLVHAFHAVSDDIKENAEAFGAHNIKTIYSGLSAKGIGFHKEHKNNNRFEIISVGRWHWVKGFNYAIDAMSLLEKTKLDFHYTIIAGDGTEEALYHIRSLGLEQHISVMQEMPHNEVIDRMKNADLLLLPSISEGVANVVLEAMSVGTVVLSTDCGGISEVIKDGYNGFLVPVRDSLAIAGRIAAIAAMDKEKLQAIRCNARKTVEEQHDMEKMIDDFTALYQSVLQ